MATYLDRNIWSNIRRLFDFGLFPKMATDNEFQLRRRFTIAEINTGTTILTAMATAYGQQKYRLVDVAFIAIGGAAGGATTVDILATQSAASVKLVAVAIAALTQSALVRAGAANATILANGASFVANDANTAITIGKTGGSLTTATHIDVILCYAIDQS